MQRDSEIPLLHRRGGLTTNLGARTVAAIVLVTLTIGLVLVVASLPWRQFSADSRVTERYYLGCYFVEYAPASCLDYADRGAPLRDVFPRTFALVLTALTFSLLQLTFLVRSLFGGRGRHGILVTGTLGSLNLLVAPLYFYFGLSGSQYSGSFVSNGVSSSWSDEIGWLIAPYVAIFFFEETILTFFAARHVTLPVSGQASQA